MANEIRQNKTTGQWVIVAPERRGRPREPGAPAEADEAASHDPECPFCPGNEERLSSVLLELPEGDGWQTRVVGNPFPVLSPDIDPERSREGVHLRMGGHGRHEVIVDSPHHDRRLGGLSQNGFAAVLETYRRRYRDLMREHRHLMILVFRNQGRRAGTTLRHPHSQIVASGVVPSPIRQREQEAQRHYDRWGRCVVCEVAAYEAREGRRVIFENGSFLAFVPFAAEVPYEVWIVPTRHRSDFGDTPDARMPDMAEALRSVLQRMETRIDDLHYNLVINTCSRFHGREPHLHWYVQVRPRLTTPMGFEIGAGIPINPHVPEEDADDLNRR